MCILPWNFVYRQPDVNKFHTTQECFAITRINVHPMHHILPGSWPYMYVKSTVFYQGSWPYMLCQNAQQRHCWCNLETVVSGFASANVIRLLEQCKLACNNSDAEKQMNNMSPWNVSWQIHQSDTTLPCRQECFQGKKCVSDTKWSKWIMKRGADWKAF